MTRSYDYNIDEYMKDISMNLTFIYLSFIKISETGYMCPNYFTNKYISNFSNNHTFSVLFLIIQTNNTNLGCRNWMESVR